MSGAASVSSLSLPARRRTGALFGITFIIAAVLAAMIVWFASSGPSSQQNVAGPLRVVITGLVVNGGLICGLIVLVGLQVLSVMRSRAAGSRLHLRYMSLFALAAV